MKNFDEALVFADLVVNENWTVEQFAHPRAFSNGATHAGKASQQLNMIKQGIAEAR